MDGWGDRGDSKVKEENKKNLKKEDRDVGAGSKHV